jgi:hypothetical protein
MNLTVTGPYQYNGKDQLPSADLKFKVQAPSASFEGRIISTAKTPQLSRRELRRREGARAALDQGHQ